MTRVLDVDTDDPCVCGHVRFDHYCFGGYCMVRAPRFGQGEDGWRAFRLDVTVTGARERSEANRALFRRWMGYW